MGPQHNNRMRVLTLAGVFVIGLLAGAGVMWSITRSRQVDPGTELRLGGYEYINPLLACEEASVLQTKNLRVSKKKAEDVASKYIKEGIASRVAVYYRDLNNGPWWGIHEDDVFAPASLLKVPVMMAYYKAAETDPGILTKELRFEDGPPESTEELIRRMIVDSANDAFTLLVSNIEYARIREMHEALGIPLPANGEDDFLTVKQYASLFRVLYNASYLSRDMSERALTVLADAAFDVGIAAGIPRDVKLANKYGIQEHKNTGQQLHDCGVVYAPGNPFLLCIMTAGEHTGSLQSVISDITQTVYKEVTQ